MTSTELAEGIPVVVESSFASYREAVEHGEVARHSEHFSKTVYVAVWVFTAVGIGLDAKLVRHIRPLQLPLAVAGPHYMFASSVLAAQHWSGGSSRDWHDVGVIQLTKAVRLDAGQYGKLPAVNQLDALNPGSSTVFTAVGYGLQRINPVFVQRDLIRMSAQPHLIQINTGLTGDFSLLLSNNASTGGTCFGDSGGPNYLGSSNTIAAVTSFGLNGNCAGTGGVFRLDRQNVLDFVRQFLN